MIKERKEEELIYMHMVVVRFELPPDAKLPKPEVHDEESKTDNMKTQAVPSSRASGDDDNSETDNRVVETSSEDEADKENQPLRRINLIFMCWFCMKQVFGKKTVKKIDQILKLDTDDLPENDHRVVEFAKGKKPGMSRGAPNTFQQDQTCLSWCEFED
ncbi:unnamed protein product [Caretta caretta]